jgi:hypothetical protein
MLSGFNLAPWLDWVIKFAAFALAVGTLWRYVARPCWRGVRSFIHGISMAVDGVEYVRSQMVNNGGSTIKDAVDTTAGQVAEIVDRLDAIDKRVEFLEMVHRKQDEVDRIVAENTAKLAAMRPTLHLPPPNKESA